MSSVVDEGRRCYRVEAKVICRTDTVGINFFHVISSRCPVVQFVYEFHVWILISKLIVTCDGLDCRPFMHMCHCSSHGTV
jgi:hypothetical protein